MSTLLDFVQTLAIINLQNKHKEENKKFDPLELTTKDFLFYTLTIFDIRNPEETITLLKKRRADENTNLGMNYYIRMTYGTVENAIPHYRKYNKESNEIIDEVILFYNDLSTKSHFILSQIHIDKIQNFSDRLITLQNTFSKQEETIRHQTQKLQKEKNDKANNQATIGCSISLSIIIFSIILAIVVNSFIPTLP